MKSWRELIRGGNPNLLCNYPRICCWITRCRQARAHNSFWAFWVCSVWDVPRRDPGGILLWWTSAESFTSKMGESPLLSPPGRWSTSPTLWKPFLESKVRIHKDTRKDLRAVQRPLSSQTMRNHFFHLYLVTWGDKGSKGVERNLSSSWGGFLVASKFVTTDSDFSSRGWLRRTLKSLRWII